MYLIWRWTVGGREEPRQDGTLFAVLVRQESPELSVKGATVNVRHGDDVALLEVLALWIATPMLYIFIRNNR